MDSQLESDLADALEGCDPLESILDDPDLVRVAQEVYESNSSDTSRLDENCENNPTTDAAHVNINSSASQFLIDFGRQIVIKYRQCAVRNEATLSSSPSSSLISSDGESCKKSKKNYQCVACGKPAKGYLYFGVMVCFGCRSFFSRSIKDELHKSYICSELHDSRSWTKCRRCRFVRLIKVGMKVPRPGGSEEEEVIDGNDSKFTCPEDKGTVKQYVDRIRELLMCSTSMTVSEKLAVEEITSWHLKTSFCLMNNLIRMDRQFLRNILEFFYLGKNFSAKTRKVAERYHIYGTQKSFAQSGCWLVKDDLTVKDMDRLLAANFPLVYEYSEAYKIKSGNFWAVTGEVKSYVDSLVFGLKDEEERKNIVDTYLEVILKC